jgi:hypothetical protein
VSRILQEPEQIAVGRHNQSGVVGDAGLAGIQGPDEFVKLHRQGVAAAGAGEGRGGLASALAMYQYDGVRA